MREYEGMNEYYRRLASENERIKEQNKSLQQELKAMTVRCEKLLIAMAALQKILNR